jgi:t-SNARE complex subunit (syntaxin)
MLEAKVVKSLNGYAIEFDCLVAGNYKYEKHAKQIANSINVAIKKEIKIETHNLRKQIINYETQIKQLNNALDQAIFRLKHYATNTDKSPQAKNTLRCFLKQINDIKEGKEKE